MRKLLTALILISVLLFAACGSEPKDPPAPVESTDTEPVTNEPIDRKQAIKIASEYWGVKSGEVDEETGFKMNLFVDESPTAESNSFRIVLRWLVDGHYSMVDEVYIDADTGEVILQDEDTGSDEPIDRDRAIELASQYWEVEPGEIDEATGYRMNIFVDAEPDPESNRFKMSLQWLVEGEFYSKVDEVFIDADSGEISYPGGDEF